MGVARLAALRHPNGGGTRLNAPHLVPAALEPLLFQFSLPQRDDAAKRRPKTHLRHVRLRHEQRRSEDRHLSTLKPTFSRVRPKRTCKYK